MKQKQNNTLHRHDISDRAWKIIEPHLPGRGRTKSRPAKDNRKFINAVIWILRTGAPGRDLSLEYGDWNNTHRRLHAGETKEFVQNFLKLLSKTLILNGL